MGCFFGRNKYVHCSNIEGGVHVHNVMNFFQNENILTSYSFPPILTNWLDKGNISLVIIFDLKWSFEYRLFVFLNLKRMLNIKFHGCERAAVHCNVYLRERAFVFYDVIDARHYVGRKNEYGIPITASLFHNFLGISLPKMLWNSERDLHEKVVVHLQKGDNHLPICIISRNVYLHSQRSFEICTGTDFSYTSSDLFNHW